MSQQKPNDLYIFKKIQLFKENVMDKYELHKIISIEKYFENIKSGMRFYF